MIRFSLDKIMKKRNIEQKDVVALTGINRNTVKSLATNANTRIDFPTLNALCEGLNVTPGDLIEHIKDNTERGEL